MKILLIEDDEETVGNVAHALKSQGHEIEISGNGADGATRARLGLYSALIVDRMLPGLDGLKLVQGLRAEGIQVPILFLTTMSGIDDRVEGLESGADDYLTKPFAAAELLARVNAITRRAELQSGEAVVLKADDLEMNLIKRTVVRRGQNIDLQPQEFKLLEYLVRNAGKIVTRAMLLENVWDLHFDPRTNIVETHMSRLRAKLSQKQHHDPIQTIRGTGYIIRAL